jgi:hypothetical protein
MVTQAHLVHRCCDAISSSGCAVCYSRSVDCRNTIARTQFNLTAYPLEIFTTQSGPMAPMVFSARGWMIRIGHIKDLLISSYPCSPKRMNSHSISWLCCSLNCRWHCWRSCVYWTRYALVNSVRCMQTRNCAQILRIKACLCHSNCTLGCSWL